MDYGRDELPLVSAVIPNWNGKNQIVQCLRSITLLDYPKDRLEVIVVDNGSTDGSPETIEGELEQMRSRGFQRLRLIRNQANVGAPKAINQAIKEIDPATELIWKLDNDVEFSEETLWEYVKTLREGRGRRVAAVSGLLFNAFTGLEEPFGSVFLAIPRRWTLILELVDSRNYKNSDVELAALAGTCCLFDRRAVDAVGLYEERFFHYYDDTEFCLRLRKNGYNLEVVPSVRIKHHSDWSLHTITRARIYYGVRNLLLCGHLYFRGAERILFHSLQPMHFLWRFIRILTRFRTENILATARLVFVAYMDFYLGRLGRRDAI
jgi:hypothetical protein